MPCFKMLTNIAKSKLPKDLLVKIVPVLVEGVKKTPDRFVCTIEGDCHLTIEGDTTTPGVVATLESIGNLGPDENKKIVTLLSTFMERELGVTPNRFFLTFYDLKAHNVAREGITRDV